jgi:hypothetical protein
MEHVVVFVCIRIKMQLPVMLFYSYDMIFVT